MNYLHEFTKNLKKEIPKKTLLKFFRKSPGLIPFDLVFISKPVVYPLKIKNSEIPKFFEAKSKELFKSINETIFKMFEHHGLAKNSESKNYYTITCSMNPFSYTMLYKTVTFKYVVFVKILIIFYKKKKISNFLLQRI